MDLSTKYELTEYTNIREIKGDPMILVNPYIAKRVFLPRDPNNVMRLTLSLIQENKSLNEIINRITKLGNLDDDKKKLLQARLSSFLSRLENLNIIKRCD